MIASFACKDNENLFKNKYVKRFHAFSRAGQIKLKLLNAAKHVNDLRAPPGNRLELLIGDRKNQYSIRINNQWRLCFVWHESNAYNVEIIDYH